MVVNVHPAKNMSREEQFRDVHLKQMKQLLSLSLSLNRRQYLIKEVDHTTVRLPTFWY